MIKLRKIKIETWKAKVPEFAEDGKTIVGTKDVDENLLIALNNLIGAKDPKDIPRGLDKFRLFGRITKAFDNCEKNGNMLILEEGDYSFLKETIEKDIPSTWGMNEKLSKSIEEFLNAKEEKQ